MEKRYLTPKEFAQFSRMGLKTVYRRLKAGQLPAIQSGGPDTMWSIDTEARAASVTVCGTAVVQYWTISPERRMRR